MNCWLQRLALGLACSGIVGLIGMYGISKAQEVRIEKLEEQSETYSQDHDLLIRIDSKVENLKNAVDRAIEKQEELIHVIRSESPR